MTAPVVSVFVKLSPRTEVWRVCADSAKFLSHTNKEINGNCFPAYCQKIYFE